MVVRPKFLLLAAILGVTGVAQAADPPRIAVITDGPSDLFDQVTRLLANEANALLGEGVCPKTPTAHGDFTLASVEALLTGALADSGVDWIVGVGPLVGQVVGKRKSLSKPVFLPFAAPGPMLLPIVAPR